MYCVTLLKSDIWRIWSPKLLRAVILCFLPHTMLNRPCYNDLCRMVPVPASANQSHRTYRSQPPVTSVLKLWETLKLWESCGKNKNPQAPKVGKWLWETCGKPVGNFWENKNPKILLWENINFPTISHKKSHKQKPDEIRHELKNPQICCS